MNQDHLFPKVRVFPYWNYTSSWSFVYIHNSINVLFQSLYQKEKKKTEKLLLEIQKKEQEKTLIQQEKTDQFVRMKDSFHNLYNNYCVQVDRNLVLSNDNRRLESEAFSVSKIR